MYFFIIRVLTVFSVYRNFCRSILIKLFSFPTIVTTVLQTDFFCNKFRRTNNLFGPPSCLLRYFSKDKRKTLWGHNDCYCWGRGGGRTATKRNTGMGRKGKMKLRLVKFFTSRENEIEKEEEGGRRPNISCLAVTQPGRGQSPLPLPFPSFSHHFRPPLPPPAPPTYLLLRSSLSAATCRQAVCPGYLLPSCPTSPFLLHKITEAEKRGACCVAWCPASRPSQPTQL